MPARILTPDDEFVIPYYVALFNKGLEEISRLYSISDIQKARAKYTESYISENLVDSDIRFVGHFTGNLDGLLIESFDDLDGQRTVINWVMADKKGQGIGTSLINDCLNRARYENKDNVSLGVFIQNPARELYKRLGFISGGTYNKNGHTMEVMSYIL